MVKVEIRDLAGHQRRIGQACAFILGGVLGNGQRSRHSLANRVRAAGRCTGRAFALANIKGDTKTLIAVELDRLDLTLTHRSGQALLQRHRNFAGAGALATCFGDDRLDLFLQRRQVLGAYALDCTHGSLHSKFCVRLGSFYDRAGQAAPTGYHGGDF